MTSDQPEELQQIKVPNGQKIKQISQTSYGMNGRMLGTTVRGRSMVLTESGKIYLHEIDQSNRPAQEFPLPHLEDDDKIVGISNYVRYAWSQKGHIFDLNERHSDD